MSNASGGRFGLFCSQRDISDQDGPGADVKFVIIRRRIAQFRPSPMSYR
jgi:hypothetical protein